jgi:hypothetical protein
MFNENILIRGLNELLKKKVKQSHNRPVGPRGFQEV